MRGLATQGTDPERQIKHRDFIDNFAALGDNDRMHSPQDDPDEDETMSSLAKRFTSIGDQRGVAVVFLRRLRGKFGDDSAAMRGQVELAGPEALRNGTERVQAAQSIEAEVIEVEVIEEVLH